jgi:hypothetical protein
MMVITDSTLTREETQHKEQRRQKKEAELGSGVAGAAEYNIQGRKQGLGLPVALTLMKICSASFSLFLRFSFLPSPSHHLLFFVVVVVVNLYRVVLLVHTLSSLSLSLRACVYLLLYSTLYVCVCVHCVLLVCRLLLVFDRCVSLAWQPIGTIPRQPLSPPSEANPRSLSTSAPLHLLP